MNTFMVGDVPHRTCDCDPHKSECKRGGKRVLLTTEFSRCLVPCDQMYAAVSVWGDGTIERADRFGLGFVSVGGTSIPFTFDRIEGYRGQQPKEIGLKKGRSVSVLLVDGKVHSLRLNSLEPQKRTQG